MSKLSKLLLSTALGCVVHLTQAATHIDPLLSEGAIEERSLNGEGTQRIQQALEQNQATLRTLKNKDITVFLGDTGAGKSTLINLLADVPLKTDTRGNVVTQEIGKGMSIGSGGRSVTKHPHYIDVDSTGVLCDLPGFEDTDGALDDVINAAFIRTILTNARSVKAVFVTSGADIEAVRGLAFKRLLQAMKMFAESEFHQSSSILVINKLDRELLLPGHVAQMLQDVIMTGDTMGRSLLDGLLQANKVVVVPKSRYGDREHFLRDAKQNILGQLQSISGVMIRPEHLNMALTFNADTTASLVGCFYDGLKDLLVGTNAVLDTSLEESFRKFEMLIFQNSIFNILSPLSHRQYEIALKNFKPYFEKEHELFQQKKLAQKAKDEAALADRKRFEAVEEQKKAQQKAEESLRRGKQLDEARVSAEQEAATLKAQAQKIQQSVTHNQKEKEEALLRAREAEKQKQTAEKDALEQRELSKKMQVQQQQALHRMKELEAAQQRAQQEAENIESRLRQQYQNASRDKDRELSSLRSDLRDLQREQGDAASLRRRISQLEQEQGNVRDLRSQIERLQEQLSEKNQEIRQLRSRQQQGGGGGHILVQTPFGLQLMPQGGFGGGGFY